MKRRILTIVLAVVLAALGTAGVLAYVKQANARALAGQKAVTVLVAGSTIPAGTSASSAWHNGMLTKQTFPASSVPADAISSISSDVSGLVLSSDLQAGQILLRPLLVAQAVTTGALAIPAGMVAVTLALCVPESVAGYVHAGSEVAVFDTETSKSMSVADCGGNRSQSVTGTVRTRMVLPKVKVLAVGTATQNAQATATAHSASGLFSSGSSSNSNNSASQSNAILVTLAVNQADAERLILIGEAGLPYLALLSGSSHTAFDTTFVPLFRR